MKKLSVLALVLVLVLAFASCDMIELPANGDVKLAQAALDAAFAETEIEITEDLVLSKKLTDAEGNEYEVAWAASANVTLEDGEDKVTVKVQQDLFNDLVFAVAGAITVGEETAKISLTYTVPALVEEGQKLADAALEAAFANKELEATKNFTLLTELEDAQGNKYALTWVSSDEAVLKVEGGNVTVTPSYFGNAVVTLTGTAVNGKVASTVVLTYTVAKVECEHDYEMFAHTDSTCTEFGNESYRCKNCGRTYMISLPMIPHNFEVTDEVVAPTCDEAGYTVYACTVCGAEKADDFVDALGHEWQVTDEVVPPTCLEPGYTVYVCTVCDAKAKGDHVEELLPHNYTIYYDTIAPTCTEDGYDRVVCDICGKYYEKQNIVPATGHDYASEVTTPATCTEAGVMTYTCSVCEDTYTEEIPAGHDYVDGVCSVCEAVDPNYYAVVSIPEALAAADGKKIQVSGTVCAINSAWSDSYGNISVTIVDAEGNQLYLYRLGTNVALGDIITAKGVMATYNEARQMAQGGTATIDGHDSSYDYEEMTVAEALAAADGTNVIVTGTVVKINTAYSSQYKNISVTIADENGDQLYVYRLAGGETLAVNDIITIKGAMDTYNGARQLAGGTYTDTGADHACSNYTEATCKKLAACVVCGATTGELAAHNYVDGACTVCGELEGVTIEKFATFALGANGSAAHNDGSEITAAYTETADGYTLGIGSPTKAYKGGRDAKGNSCIKLGTGSAAGKITFTVDENVTKVIIYVGGYKSTAAKIQVNGVDYTINDMSNDGAYTAIEVDTTATNTITITTVSGGYRCMINTVEYYGYAE